MDVETEAPKLLASLPKVLKDMSDRVRIRIWSDLGVSILLYASCVCITSSEYNTYPTVCVQEVLIELTGINTPGYT